MPWTTPKTWNVNELLTAAALNTHLRDNLNALKEPPTGIAAVPSTYTTTSTSFVTIDAANLAATLTTSGGNVLIGFTGAWAIGAVGYLAYLTITMDNVNVAGVNGVALTSVGGAVPLALNYLLTGVAAGAHTFRLQWRVTGNTATLYSLGQLWAREVS
ncbi:MAG TPA: hypothetical protein PKD09_24890 [Aggregatilinea sp.]|uniref:hypothetical protein n=1 Tax=Aggregatilinea sp. TaxID=2806333 RepID=UPI002C8130A2|nr:hypothetical protein [Aggregatilinea sp.]HML24915.1 hypothetical protein [Aggregatilinea sp.]